MGTFFESWSYFFAWIGFIVMIVLSVFLAFFLLYQLYVFVLNSLGKRFKEMWSIIEFMYYRKEFKEWVKNKERHPKAK